MSEEWVGVSNVSQKLIIVRLRFAGNSIHVVDDVTWDLQGGERAEAYSVMHERILNYFKENDIQFIVIKSSEVNISGARKVHLEAAELRGVIMAASILLGVPTRVLSKAHVSRTFGERKTGEYVEDDHFWENQIQGTLRKGSRETALLILAARK